MGRITNAIVTKLMGTILRGDGRLDSASTATVHVDRVLAGIGENAGVLVEQQPVGTKLTCRDAILEMRQNVSV